MPLSQDPSIVAEKMLKDRLTAVKKQAEDHAVQLKQNGFDLLKKHENNSGNNIALKKEESSIVDTIDTVRMNMNSMWCMILSLFLNSVGSHFFTCSSSAVK